ncbi:MAG: BREX-1 system adenine-specific DNA-methyltransferase PglX [Methanospirillaceae archaeon]|nr:BREX-1 system adenine-specific DNA-methyltransferase PglX [Methanospirillaceae archaeon]
MADIKTNNPVPNFYRASAEDFRKIPGSPIAYWVSDKFSSIFENKKVSDFLTSEGQIITGNNEKFLRFFWEVAQNLIGKNGEWKLHHKGGLYRKWYGNVEWVVDWSEISREFYKKDNTARIPKEEFWDLLGITWSTISSSKISFRKVHVNESYNKASPTLSSSNEGLIDFLLAYLNTNIISHTLYIINPTLNYLVKDVEILPVNSKLLLQKAVLEDSKSCLLISKTDWNSYETSWDFATLPLISPDYLSPTIETSYKKLRSNWQEMTDEMKELEEENNRIFIEAYGLEDELTPEVPLSEITLTCNPHYRYNSNKSEEELESLLLTDTVKELISYAVGCMVGRYGLDKPGLILANQGETVGDYLSQVPNPTFPPDDDNIIPILDDEYFTDDIVSRFKEFLKVVFGKETLSQNLDFIAKALTGKTTSSPEKVIRDYFLKDFYKDHVQRYKKRPIYWIFSSGKQQGFNALIYMHRYNKTTLAKMRTDYLLELQAKLDAELSILLGDPAKNKIRITRIKNQLEEMKSYDELLNNKALAMIEIDLDDGVVVNYAKFEGLVRKI